MTIYKNGLCYFVKAAPAPMRPGKEPSSAGYEVYQSAGAWYCDIEEYYDYDLERLPIVAETKHDISTIIKNGIIAAVTEAVSGEETT